MGTGTGSCACNPSGVAFTTTTTIPLQKTGTKVQVANSSGQSGVAKQMSTALTAEGFRQVTSPPSAFRSFPAWLPLGSLDKAFARGVEIGHARVVRTSLTRVASDHLPLVVDFHLA